MFEDKNAHKDELEELFGRLFNDESAISQAQGWNNPDETMWEGIEADLEEEPQKKRRLVYWPWLVGIASILIWWQGYSYHQKIKQLNLELEEQKQAVIELRNGMETGALPTQKYPTESNHQQYDTLKQHNSTRKTDSLNVLIKSVTTPSTLNQSNTRNFQGSPQAINEHESPYKSDKVNLSPIFSIKNSKKEKKPIGLIDHKVEPQERPQTFVKEPALNTSKKLLDTKDLAFLETRNLELLTQTKRGLNQLPIISPVAAALPENKFYGSVIFSPTWNSIRLEGNESVVTPFLPSMEHQDKAYAVGLSLGYKKNDKWIAEIGVKYNYSVFSINHARQIPFQILQEQLNQEGNFESVYILQLGASSGAVEADVVLFRNAATEVNNNTNLELDMNFTNTTHLLDIPLVLGRQWQFGRLALQTKAGVNNRFLLHQDYQWKQARLDDVRFQLQTGNIEAKPQIKSPKRYTLQYLVGLGMEYKVAPKWSAFAEYQFSRSLSPVISFGPAKIYMESQIVNIGLRHQL